MIERPYTSWARNDRAKARITAQLEGQIRQFPPETPYKIMDNEPDIATLFIHDDGSIWVLTSRAMWEPKPGVLKTFDVFSPSGEYVKQVDVIAEGSSSADLLIFARNNLVFKITGFYDAIVAAVGGLGADTDEEAEAMEIVCYQAQ